jgi:tetratricopeptide (TPR) repeat protein
MPQPAPEISPADQAPPEPEAGTEIIAPVRVSLRSEQASGPEHRQLVMASLTTHALWIHDNRQLRRIPLRTLSNIEMRRDGRELGLTIGSEASAERPTLVFASAAEGQRWCQELQTQQQRTTPDAMLGDQPVPKSVFLLRQTPDVPHVILGRALFTDGSRATAERGLQLRAAMQGADAVVAVDRHKFTESGRALVQMNGLAIRAADPAAAEQLGRCSYAEQLSSLVKRVLFLVVGQAALLLVATVFCTGAARFNGATGETPSEALTSAGLGIGAIYGGPLVLAVLLWVLRWPELLRTVGLAVLAVTTLRGLTVVLAHVLAVRSTGAPLQGSALWLLLDPIDWAFIVAGVFMFSRAWRLRDDAIGMLGHEVQDVSRARKLWARGLFGATALATLGLVTLVGISRYDTSAYLLQPGADPLREQQALLALNEGAAQAQNGNLEAADRSFQQALRLWEELTAKPSVPSLYRANLTQTLYNLAWLRHKKGRLDEAEAYYARAVAAGERVASDAQTDDHLKQILADARAALADLRTAKSFEQLDEKDHAAWRKFEEAQVKAEKGDDAAEGLCKEAIALWEEVLPHATSTKYRKHALTRLAVAYLWLAEMQQQPGKRPESEASLRKAIDYGEKAVELEPDRPLTKHNLEIARQRLERLHEQALQEEIAKLCEAQRFADAIEVCQRSIEEHEEQVRSGKDHDGAVRRLAYRLDRLAWLLAHCPDERVRDTKVAIKRARRATELQPDVGEYWYTLAMVQYRHGVWRDSLAALEGMKAKEGELDATGWLLTAMNRQQLKERDQARAAFRKAIDWIEEQQRKAEGNALLRFRLEMMRPTIEALRREAENLIENKDPGGEKARKA